MIEKGHRRARLLVLSAALGHVLLDGVDHGRVEQGGDVAQRAVVGHVAQEAPHDLAAAGLGQLGREQDLARLGDRADLARHVVAQLADQRLARLALRRRSAPLTVTKATMAWPVVASFAPTTAASATAGWLDQRVLDLGGRDAVARDVHDVVDPAQQPEVAVLVALGAVAGEVAAGEARPVRLPVALVVAVDAAQHAGPGLGDDEVAALVVADRVAVVVDDVGRDAGEGRHGRTRAWWP